jgi:hypothetical protein
MLPIIQSKHRVEAKIGQGGPEISLVTTNGSIKITKCGFPKIRGADDAHTPGDPFHPQGQGGHPGDPAAGGST